MPISKPTPCWHDIQNKRLNLVTLTQTKKTNILSVDKIQNNFFWSGLMKNFKLGDHIFREQQLRTMNFYDNSIMAQQPSGLNLLPDGFMTLLDRSSNRGGVFFFLDFYTFQGLNFAKIMSSHGSVVG